MDFKEFLFKGSSGANPSLFTGTGHRMARGAMATLLGECSAATLRRVSMYPPRRIDLVGILLIPVVRLARNAPFYEWVTAISGVSVEFPA